MNKILYTISGREKCYKFLLFLEKFLTSNEPNPKKDSLCWIIKQIGSSIGLAKHINKFGETFENFKTLKNKLNSGMIFSLSLNELFSLSSDLLKILDTFLDHLIFLCKRKIINENMLKTLNRLSGIIWFLDISKTFGLNFKIYYYDNNKFTLKEKCKIIKSIFDYIVLLNYSCDEYLLPNWLFSIFGMLSSALNIYTAYLLK
jgi:hypothetical protein